MLLREAHVPQDVPPGLAWLPGPQPNHSPDSPSTHRLRPCCPPAPSAWKARAPISTGRQVWVPLQSPREVFPPLPPTPSRAGPKGTVHHRPCQPVPCVYPRGPLNPQPAVEQGLPRASWLSEQMRKLLYFSRALREFLQGGCRNLSLEGQGCLWVSAHSLNLAMTPR